MENEDLKPWQINPDFFLNTNHANLNDFEREVELPTLSRRLGPHSDRSVLELGCGNGFVLDNYFPLANKRVGVDGSENILLSRKPTNAIEFRKFDLSSGWPDLGGEVDIIFSRYVFMFIRNLDHIAREVAHNLHFEGIFGFTVTHPMYPYLLELEGKNQKFRNVGKYGTSNRGSIKMGDGEYPFYYRPMEDYIKPFIRAGLKIKSFDETMADNSFLSAHPTYEYMRGKPACLTMSFLKN